MKKILLSIAMVAAMGALVAGATGAFYNDTENSSGNIFVAGSIDLKVDHSLQTYNGVNCKTCDVTIQSDTENLVIEKDGSPITPYNALLATPAGDWTSVPGAQWIWGESGIPAGDDQTEYTFKNTFTWFGPALGVDLDLSISGDDNYKVYLNGTFVGETTTGNVWQNVYQHTGFESLIEQGENEITFVVKNTGGYYAGLIYKLTIDGNCQADYFKQQCRLWDEKDLSEGDSFFNFNDVKPGDFGTNVISLHVSDNDAYACLIATDKDDQENSLVPPESANGDAPNQGLPQGFGELSKYLDVFTWVDANGNGVYEPPAESALTGPVHLDTAGSLGSLDPSTSQSLTATTTKNVGLAWCAGSITVDLSGVHCAGSGIQNDAQTDSFSASLTAYAEQTRNNPNFSCADIANQLNNPQ